MSSLEGFTEQLVVIEVNGVEVKSHQSDTEMTAVSSRERNRL